MWHLLPCYKFSCCIISQVKSKQSTLAEMNAYLQKRQEEDDELKGDIDDIMQHISRYDCCLNFHASMKF